MQQKLEEARSLIPELTRAARDVYEQKHPSVKEMGYDAHTALSLEAARAGVQNEWTKEEAERHPVSRDSLDRLEALRGRMESISEDLYATMMADTTESGGFLRYVHDTLLHVPISVEYVERKRPRIEEEEAPAAAAKKKKSKKTEEEGAKKSLTVLVHSVAEGQDSHFSFVVPLDGLCPEHAKELQALVKKEANGVDLRKRVSKMLAALMYDWMACDMFKFREDVTEADAPDHDIYVLMSKWDVPSDLALSETDEFGQFCDKMTQAVAKL